MLTVSQIEERIQEVVTNNETFKSNYDAMDGVGGGRLLGMTVYRDDNYKQYVVLNCDVQIITLRRFPDGYWDFYGRDQIAQTDTTEKLRKMIIVND